MGHFEHVFEFIKKLICHIPNQRVHTVRYYGFYANKSSIDLDKFDTLYTNDEISVNKLGLLWRIKLKNTYNYDPILCHCGNL